MSTLPPGLADSVAEGLELWTGKGARVVSAVPVSGGCVNDARIIRTELGAEFFLKHNPSAPAGFFEAEADGLRALGRGPLRVPEVVALGVGPRAVRQGASARGVAMTGETGGHAWLVLEYLPAGRPSPSYWNALGEGLSALHAATGDDPGYERDNFIGSLAQRNAPHPDWAEFWVERRIRPQLEMLFASGLLDPDDRIWRNAIDAIASALGSAPGAPSLLHGDLWSGNVYPDANGRPVLIDPAVYRGDPDVDLAMSELFGGFDPSFYRAYRSTRPAAPEYDQVRRTVYQLYPLLVHANLFGAGYAASARASAAIIVARLGAG